MSDLISRQDAIDAMITLGLKRAIPILATLPSAEPKRTVKVKDIVHIHGYPDEGLCGNCNEDVNGLYDYCPYCGCRLEWDE